MSETGMTEYVDLHEAKAATPHSDLIAQLLDSRIPKSEREHAAAKEITALLAERDALAQDAARLRAKLDISRELLRGIAGVRDCRDLDAFEAAEETRRQIDAAMAGKEEEG